MQTVIIVVHLMIVAVMIGAVLLQKSEGGGLGMGGGAGFMSSRGTANLLTRTTAILAGGFFLTSLWLAWIAGYDRKPASILGTAPCQGHISGVVDVPNACATLWLPTEIFDFDVMPSSAGPIKHITGDIQMPISPDK